MTVDPAQRGERDAADSAGPSSGPLGRERGGPSARRPTLNAAVRRRRTDRAFYIRLAGAISQNERALERLKR